MLAFSPKQPSSNTAFHCVHHFSNPNWCSVAPGRRPAILIQVHSLDFRGKVMLAKGKLSHSSYFCSSQKKFYPAPCYHVACCSSSSRVLALSAHTSLAHDVFSWFKLSPSPPPLKDLEMQIRMLLFLITVSTSSQRIMDLGAQFYTTVEGKKEIWVSWIKHLRKKNTTKLWKAQPEPLIYRRTAKPDTCQ